MKRFEYRIEEFNIGISLKPNYDEIHVRINRLGFEGWDLVSVILVGMSGKIVYTFKREINI